MEVSKWIEKKMMQLLKKLDLEKISRVDGAKRKR